jgi:hypothetical protein
LQEKGFASLINKAFIFKRFYKLFNKVDNY